MDRPMGRPPGNRSARVMAAYVVSQSISVLSSIQDDESAPYMARVEAAKALIEIAQIPATNANNPAKSARKTKNVEPNQRAAKQV